MFLNKTFIGDCPLFLNKTVYWRLSIAFKIKQVIGDCLLFFNKTKMSYRRAASCYENPKICGPQMHNTQYWVRK